MQKIWIWIFVLLASLQAFGQVHRPKNATQAGCSKPVQMAMIGAVRSAAYIKFTNSEFERALEANEAHRAVNLLLQTAETEVELHAATFAAAEVETLDSCRGPAKNLVVGEFGSCLNHANELRDKALAACSIPIERAFPVLR